MICSWAPVGFFPFPSHASHGTRGLWTRWPRWERWRFCLTQNREATCLQSLTDVQSMKSRWGRRGFPNMTSEVVSPLPGGRRITPDTPTAEATALCFYLDRRSAWPRLPCVLCFRPNCTLWVGRTAHGRHGTLCRASLLTAEFTSQPVMRGHGPAPTELTSFTIFPITPKRQA